MMAIFKVLFVKQAEVKLYEVVEEGMWVTKPFYYWKKAIEKSESPCQ